MSMFILIFTTGLVVLSGYFFWRFAIAFPGLGWWRLLVVVIMAVLGTGRYWGGLLRRQGFEPTQELAWLVQIFWVILLFWFLSSGLALHAWNLLAWSAAKISPSMPKLLLPPRAFFITNCTLVLLICGWAWFEAGNIRARHFVIEVEHLPPGREAILIAQITDLHLSNFGCSRQIVKMLELLQESQPDIIVDTGDFVDANLYQEEQLAGKLRALSPPLGKYAVLGNHDFYSGAAHSLAFHAAAGFRVLRQEAVL
ncbi:MAG: metallophosphoesterase, partial [Planctomycetes bacterium]|nr:metallophosphoesterase [Planctomycetota bacterium]